MRKIQYSLVAIGCLALLFILLSFSAFTTEAKSKVNHHPQQRSSNMKIQIDIEGSKQPIWVTLINSHASQDLIQQLPLSLTLKDYAATEKIANLPQKLSTQGAAKGYAGQSGDLTYYAPWGNLAFFYQDSDVGYANGLIFLGKIDSLLKEFSQKSQINILISQVK